MNWLARSKSRTLDRVATMEAGMESLALAYLAVAAIIMACWLGLIGWGVWTFLGSMLFG